MVHGTWPLKTSDIGNYQCIITGYCNSLKSNIAALSVISGFEEANIKGITIYPNPSKGMVYIDFDNVSNIKDLRILTLTGEQVYSKQKMDKTETIDLSKFSDGVYFIIIQKDNDIIRNKLIIQK